jgi:hypothetical protein
MNKFEGVCYRTCTNWFDVIPMEDKPYTYLEIGALHGANVVSFCESYGIHKDTKVYVIDPFAEYLEYNEYKNKQQDNYQIFLKNIEPYKEKITFIKEYSHLTLPELPDNYFDLIYVDANHEALFVLEDMVMSFRKLKRFGIMIMDDSDWIDTVRRGIDAFLHAFDKKVKVLREQNSQMFIQKL